MSRADHPNDPFTLDELVHAFRGMPRQALIYVETAEGLKPVVLVTATHVSAEGEPGAGPAGRYAVVLQVGPGDGA